MFWLLDAWTAGFVDSLLVNLWISQCVWVSEFVHVFVSVLWYVAGFLACRVLEFGNYRCVTFRFLTLFACWNFCFRISGLSDFVMLDFWTCDFMVLGITGFESLCLECRSFGIPGFGDFWNLDVWVWGFLNLGVLECWIWMCAFLDLISGLRISASLDCWTSRFIMSGCLNFWMLKFLDLGSPHVWFMDLWPAESLMFGSLALEFLDLRMAAFC